MSVLLRLLGLSATGSASLFALASGAVLMGIGRLPSWLAGTLAIAVLAVGSGLLGWLHIAPNYRVGIVSEMAELNQNHAYLKLKSPFDIDSAPAVASYELLSLSDVAARDWAIARGAVRTSASGREIFEIEDITSVSLALPVEWKAKARRHLPVPPAALGVAAAGLCLLFFWGLAGLSAAAVVSAAAIILAWHGAAMLGFDGVILLPQLVHMLTAAFAGIVGFRVALASPWVVREGLGRVVATTALPSLIILVACTESDVIQDVSTDSGDNDGRCCGACVVG